MEAQQSRSLSNRPPPARGLKLKNDKHDPSTEEILPSPKCYPAQKDFHTVTLSRILTRSPTALFFVYGQANGRLHREFVDGTAPGLSPQNQPRAANNNPDGSKPNRPPAATTKRHRMTCSHSIRSSAKFHHDSAWPGPVSQLEKKKRIKGSRAHLLI